MIRGGFIGGVLSLGSGMKGGRFGGLRGWRVRRLIWGGYRWDFACVFEGVA